MSVESLLSLHDKLREDHWRARHAFSKDMQHAGKLMLQPFAYDDEVAEALRLWCMKRQPCQFGRVAASRRQIHVCIVRERDLADGDASVAEKISAAKRHWKQRAVTDTTSPPHAFLLVFSTARLSLATPDENLRRFADRALVLAGWAPSRRAKRGENPVSSDFLYLQNPADETYAGFQFNIDFFAAAGDRRWWHDHRLPGGIGFTANSTGHMKAFLEWYKEKGIDHGDWALKQAMITIAQAHPTKNGEAKVSADPGAAGRLTWLRELDDRGRPLLSHLSCPMKDLPKQLAGKDWTKYEGLIHTDHAVRDEFFADRDASITATAPYIQDLTYLFDRSQADFVHFTGGKAFTEDEVLADTGNKDAWTRRTGLLPKERSRTADEGAAMSMLLKDCEAWEPLEDYLDQSPPV